MASPQIQFRAIGELANELERRTENGKPASEIARRDLERYYEMLKRSLPKFSFNEAQLMVDVFNGTLIQPFTVQLLWAEVSDAVEEGYAEKWEVDGTALVQKLRSLSSFECMAVADAIERIWRGDYHITDMDEQIRASGLVAPA